jgi:hypothetical protein
MIHGQQTAQVARTLMQRLQPLGFDVLLGHGQRETDLEYLGEIVSWFSDEYKRNTRLAFLDIAVVSRITDKALVLVEVEERPASPKKILADVLATLIGDHISFTRHSQRRDLKVGSWTKLVVLVSAHSRTAETRLSSLRDRLDKVKDQLTTPNSSIEQIIIDSYADHPELERKLIDQTENVRKMVSLTTKGREDAPS